MAEVARHRGVPDAAIMLETRSRTTVENVDFSITLLAREGLLPSVNTVHLVSCGLHMRRVSVLARTAFGPGVQLLASPHDESCTAATWTGSTECRERVLAELRLVRRLLGTKS
jgi:hypothetical protein